MLDYIKAKKEHIPDILRITKAAFQIYLKELHCPASLKALSETEEDVMRDMEINKVFVALEGDVILGSVRIEKLTDDLAYIYRFSVSPFEHNLGVGSGLLEFAINYCFSRGYSKIALHTNSKYYKLARYYYGKEFYVHSTNTEKGYIRALFIKDLLDKEIDISSAFNK